MENDYEEDDIDPLDDPCTTNEERYWILRERDIERQEREYDYLRND